MQDTPVYREARYAGKPEGVRVGGAPGPRIHPGRRGQRVLLPGQRRGRVHHGRQPRGRWREVRLI